MPDRHHVGVLDTSTYIDLGQIDPSHLPTQPELTAITLAELHQGVALARDAASRAARLEMVSAAAREFDPLPFDDTAAARFGTLVALTLAAGRSPRPRRIDLMIAAIASAWGFPLYTGNPDDFRGLENAVTVVPVQPSIEPVTPQETTG